MHRVLAEHTQNILCCLLSIGLFAVHHLSFAEIYKYKDAQGNIIYSDSPPPEQPNLAPAELPPVFIQPSVTPREKAVSTENVEIPKIRVSISAPAQDSFILPVQQNFQVTASLNRSLTKSEQTQLFVNGKPYGPAGNSTQWTISELIRGEYNLNVLVKTKDKTLAESGTTRIFVQRHIAR